MQVTPRGRTHTQAHMFVFFSVHTTSRSECLEGRAKEDAGPPLAPPGTVCVLHPQSGERLQNVPLPSPLSPNPAQMSQRSSWVHNIPVTDTEHFLGVAAPSPASECQVLSAFCSYSPIF